MPKQTETSLGGSTLPSPPRVMSLGARLRTDPAEVWGWTLFFLFGPGFLLSGLVAFGYHTATQSLTWPKYLIGYALAVAIFILPLMLLANSLVNDDAATKLRKQKQEEDEKAQKEAAAADQREYAIQVENRRNARLRDAIRLPLLEWAVENGAVEKIDHLADHLTAAVLEHYREPVLPPGDAERKALLQPLTSGMPS